MSDDERAVDPICLDIDQNDEFFVEVGLRDNEVVIVARFDKNTVPIVMSLAAYRRFVLLQLNVEHAAEILQNGCNAEKCSTCGK